MKVTNELKEKAQKAFTEIKSNLSSNSDALMSLGFLEHLFSELIKTRQNNTKASVVPIGLLKAYDAYPRKIGKSKGLAKAVRDIRDEDEIGAFGEAVSNYALYVKAQGLEQKFIKHFSTFVGEWRDWLDAPVIQEVKTPYHDIIVKIWGVNVPKPVVDLLERISGVAGPEDFRAWVNEVINAPAIADCDLNSPSLRAYLFAAMRQKYGEASGTT